MRLHNAISVLFAPAVPSVLKDRLYLATNCPFAPMEVQVFSLAFALIAEQLQSHPSPDPGIYVTAIFTDTDTLSFEIDPNDMGNFMPVIIYPLHKLRAQKYTDLQLLTIALEELCHCFWAIRDEIQVTDTVFDIVHDMYPSVRKKDLYRLHP